MKYQLLGLYFFFKAAWLSCKVDVEQGFERGRRFYKIQRIGQLDPRIDESSGLAITADGTLLSHNDSGGTPTVYEVDFTGKLLDSIALALPNTDWEDVALNDEKDIVYIADTGNNRNNRRKLRCYAYHRSTGHIDTLKLRYKSQTDFPPPSEQRYYDCEAIVYNKEELHLFSKNRGEDRVVKHYSLPVSATDKESELVPLEEILLYKQQVTAGALSPDKQTLGLLTYGRIYLFKAHESGKWFRNPWRVIKCNRMGQSEGLEFVDNESLVFSNEKGKLFSINLNKRGRKKLEE